MVVGKDSIPIQIGGLELRGVLYTSAISASVVFRETHMVMERSFANGGNAREPRGSFPLRDLGNGGRLSVTL